MKTRYYVIFSVIAIAAIFPVISFVFYGTIPVGINTRYFENCKDEVSDNGTCKTLDTKEKKDSVIDTSTIPTFDYEIKSDGVTYGSQYQIVGGTVNDIKYDK